jgi:DNA-binding PadR family transcriptional regulator
MAKPLVELQNLTKSFNEAIILASLEEGVKHGYQLGLDISERSGGTFRFNHGTLYPILHKLEKDDLIKGVWSHAGQSRKRKNYQLTARGKKRIQAQRAAWHEFIDLFSEMIGMTKP